MQFHQLRYFVSTAEKGSMSQAAKECFVSQPSLSQQIKKLEQHMGADLFLRGKNSLSLTNEGKILYKEAKNILSAIETAENKVRDYRLNKSSTIDFGVLPTVAPYIIDVVLGKLHQQYPNLKINIQEGYCDELVEACLHRKLDFIVTAAPVSDELIVNHLAKDPFCAVINENHPFAKRSEIDLCELYSESFILIKNVHCLHKQVSELCRNIGFAPKVKFETAQIETIQRLVAAGHGVSILPDISKRISKPGIIYIPLVNEPYRELVSAYRKDFVHSEVQEFFLNVINTSAG